MRPQFLALLLPALLLAACGQAPTAATSGATTPGASTPTTPVQQALPGVFQIDFNAIGTATPTSRIQSLQPGHLSAQGLVSAPDQFSFSQVTVQTFAIPATGIRHVRVTYKVTNTSSETLRNPKFVAVVPQGSTTDSVFTKVQYFDGSDATSSTNQPSLSQGQIFDAATGAATADPTANTFLTGLDVSGVDTTGKGIKTLTQTGWWLTTPPVPGQTTLMAPGESSLITFGVNVPMTPQASGGATKDPFSFSLNVTAVQDAPPAVRLSSAVKQWDETSKTFGNYVTFPTRTYQAGDSKVQPIMRSLPAYYDIDTLDGSTTTKVLCGGDKQMSVTNINTPDFPNRWRVQLFAVGEHTLNVYAGTVCNSRAPLLLSQTVTGTETSGTIIAGSDTNGLALGADGSVQLWGNFNGYGPNHSIGQVDFLSNGGSELNGFVSVSAGSNHNLLLMADGTVFGLGAVQGTPFAYSPLVLLSDRSDSVGIAAGGTSSLTLKADGTVLGGGNAARGLSGVTSIAAGSDNLALKSDGTVWGWSAGGKEVLRPMRDLSGVTSIAAGSTHGLVLKSDGTVWSWGAGDKGQLGDGNSIQQTRPVKVMGLSGVTSIFAGLEYSLAVRADGTLRSWGLNRQGQLAYPYTANQPVPIIPDVSGIAQPTPMP